MIQIPIWQTVKDIIKTICSNLLSFVSLPTIILLSLNDIFKYLYSYESKSYVFILHIISVHTVTPIIISLMQKYFYKKSDNQLSYNKLIPKLDRRQFRYVLFTIYIHFRIYLLPQILPLILCFILVSILDIPIISWGVPIILSIVILIHSVKISLGASMVHSHISVYNTDLSLKKLINISSNTLMGNKAEIFFINLIVLIFVAIIFGIIFAVSKFILNPQFYIITSFISRYILSVLTYSSINTHIYLFFKDQFEANLTKLVKIPTVVEADINLLTK